MSNVTIFLEESLLQASRLYAKEHTISFQTLVCDSLSERVNQKNSKHGLGRFLKLAKDNRGNLKNWRWNREEIYD